MAVVVYGGLVFVFGVDLDLGPPDNINVSFVPRDEVTKVL